MLQYECEKCGHMITCKHHFILDCIKCTQCGFLNKNKMERWWRTIEINKGEKK